MSLRAWVVLPLLVACGGSVELPSVDDEPIELRAWLDGPSRGAGGTLVVQTEFDRDGEIRVPEPVGEGLTFTADGGPTTEDLGQRQVVTQRYVFSGSAGSYEVPPMIATWTDPDGQTAQAESRAIFVDLDVEPPREGELADIVEPPQVWSVPWVPILGVGLLFAGGLLVAFRPRRAATVEEGPPPPPDEVALRRWDEVRRDEALDDEEKARLLALIFRQYVEDALGFGATAWTTTEIVSHLRQMSYLPEGNLPRARRLLRATDRVKFAEAHPGTDFFEDLDSDLRAFVASTRPSAWQQGAEVPPAAEPPVEGAP
jgi:hypothetical protein